MDENTQLDLARIEFPFPYSRPYDIQLKFMQSLYKTLELKRIGIFESPTGTGKSLSIICGSLKWLADFKQSQQKQLDKLVEEEENEKKKKDQESNAFDWLTDHQINFEKNRKNAETKIQLEKQVKTEKSYQEVKDKAKANRKQREKLKEDMHKKMLQTKLMNFKGEDKDANDLKRDVFLDDELDEKWKDDLEIILDDYKSDEEDDFDFGKDEDDEAEEPLTKIFFCSRTHSQITQFIGELGKTAFAENTRLVTLGSRMNLCINDVVLKLNSIQAVNDRCLELQKNKKSTNKSGSKRSKLDSDKSCPYYKTNMYEHFTLKLLEETFDIEDVAKAGREVKICPYYGARHSIPAAEIVCLPYNILFQAESRRSFSINLKNQIVIIDEAHNLIDTIASIHSVEISDNHVNQAHAQLNNYITKYKSRFSAKNMLYLRQLLSVLTGLQKLMSPKNDDVKFESENGKLSLKMSQMWTVSDFLVQTKFFNLNFVKLLRFCDQTQLEKKLMGFGEKYNAAAKDKDKEVPEVKIQSAKASKENENPTAPTATTPPVLKSPLMQIKQLIKMFSTPLYDGRLLLNIDAGKSTLKYILLNPNICFEEIASQARSVVLAGGTMKPLSDFEHLIGSKRQIEYFSCGHVIPRDNITVLAMSTGPNNIKFDFSYNSRDNVQMLDELGKQLLGLASIVPDGMVVFFVSYDYLDKIVRHFKKTSIFDQLNEKKQIFTEPRLSSECDKVFTDYTKFIKKPKPNCKQNGAMLFAVVGGKMSEGINFSDELGRCVIVIGLPYANVKSVELQEKIQYLNKHQPKGQDGKLAGQQYYESICWKAINQSIGRAIRHQNDYASILLLDARYCNQSLASLREKLPQWIGESLRQEQAHSFDNKKIADHLAKFYESKKTK